MFRFSIRNLLWVFTFLALFCAWIAAKDGEHESLRISSIAVDPDGDTAVVSLLQTFQHPRKTATRFDRTICEINAKDPSVRRVIRKDRLDRNPDIPESFFWHSQARLIHGGKNLLFLDRKRKRLLVQKLDQWKARKMAELKLGEIYSFDSNPDGSMVIFEGASEYIREMDEFDQVEELLSEEQATNANNGMIQIGMLVKTGVDSAKPIVIEPHWAKDSQIEWEKEIELELGVAKIPPGAPTDKVDRYFSWRSMVIPRTRAADQISDTIGLIGTGFSLEYSTGDIISASLEAYMQNTTHRHQWDLMDTDVSLGPYRLAKLIKNEVVLNLQTKEIPQRTHVDIAIPFETSDNSSIRLTKDGKQLAVSRGNSICFFDTDQAFPGYSPSMLNELEAMKTLVAYIQPEFQIEMENEATTFEFIDGTDLMLVGDAAGYVSLVNTNSRIIKSKLACPRQPKTMTKKRVRSIALVVLAFWWLLFCISRYLSLIHISEPTRPY